MPQSSRSSRHVKGPSGDISYSHSKSLKIPKESSSPSSWARFCNEVSILSLGGYSVAIALGDDIGASVNSASSLAEKWFTKAEADMYADWKRGRSLPRADWHRLSTDLSAKTSAQRARWNDLTDALRFMYDDGKITRENTKAWTEKYSDMMPLLNACKKVSLAREDSRYAKSSSSSKTRYDVHEIIACRSLISEIGRQRARSNSKIKQVNKEADERERDLVKRLGRLNMDEPKNREAAASKFGAREQYYGKLTKTRVMRIELNAEVARQNLEIDSAEMALKERIAIIEERLRRRAGGRD